MKHIIRISLVIGSEGEKALKKVSEIEINN